MPGEGDAAMTEAEWPPENDWRMLLPSWVRSNRKARLLAAASWAACIDLLPFESGLQQIVAREIEAVENCAEGQLSTDELAEFRMFGLGMAAGRGLTAAQEAAKSLMTGNWRTFRMAGLGKPEWHLWDDAERNPHESRERRQAIRDRLRGLFCEIFGPRNPLPTIPSNLLQWSGGTVVKIASAVYDDRAFDRLPILADALEDAGCDDADILAHCRGPGPHVRGCWVVDLVLGKT